MMQCLTCEKEIRTVSPDTHHNFLLAAAFLCFRVSISDRLSPPLYMNIIYRRPGCQMAVQPDSECAEAADTWQNEHLVCVWTDGW